MTTDITERTMSEVLRDGVATIAAERKRQIAEKGWSAEHDSQHTDESLVWAAMHYACPVDPGSKYWPDTWGDQWNQRDSDDRITQLAKAGALIAAEIDRLLRGVQP